MISHEPPGFSEDDLREARRYSLLIQWSDQDRAYIVSVPELPGCHTHGRTRDDAVAMGEEAVALWLAGLRAFALPVPEPAAYVATGS